MYVYSLAEDVLETNLRIEDSTLTLPDGPGLGVTVNYDVVGGYAYVAESWTEFH